MIANIGIMVILMIANIGIMAILWNYDAIRLFDFGNLITMTIRSV